MYLTKSIGRVVGKCKSLLPSYQDRYSHHLNQWIKTYNEYINLRVPVDSDESSRISTWNSLFCTAEKPLEKKLLCESDELADKLAGYVDKESRQYFSHRLVTDGLTNFQYKGVEVYPSNHVGGPFRIYITIKPKGNQKEPENQKEMCDRAAYLGHSLNPLFDHIIKKPGIINVEFKFYGLEKKQWTQKFKDIVLQYHHFFNPDSSRRKELPSKCFNI